MLMDANRAQSMREQLGLATAILEYARRSPAHLGIVDLFEIGQ